MKTIIAGSRDITDYSLVERYVTPVHEECNITLVICGCCKGVDVLGALWAQKNGIPIHYEPALWKKYGTAAGPKRNQVMVDMGERLIVIRYPWSRGSKDVLDRAEFKGLIVKDFEVSK